MSEAPERAVRGIETDLADGEWHRLHPATPVLKGGIGLIVVLGILITNLRERLVELFLPGAGEYESGDPVDQLVNRGLIGWALLARQGTKALADLRERARSGRAVGRELGDAGLVAAGGLLMVLPGFIGDVVGLLCLLPGTRNLVRGALTGLVLSRLPVGLRPPVRVESVRTAEVPVADDVRAPLVIEGEIVRGPDGRPLG